MIQVNRIYLIFNPVHFLVDSSDNLYEPISHTPAIGTWEHIDMLVSHIFGEQYELGLDYLQLLYLQPCLLYTSPSPRD